MHNLSYDPKTNRFTLSGDFALKKKLDVIGECRFRRAQGNWSIPYNYWSAVQLFRSVGKDNIKINPEAQEQLDALQYKLMIVRPIIDSIQTIKEANPSTIDTEGFAFQGKYQPYEHQLKMWWSAYNMLQAYNVGFFYFCGVGTGKSLAASNVAVALRHKGLVNSVLVVTPASLKFNFGEQVNIHTQETCSVLTDYSPDTRKGKDGRRWRWTKADRPITDYYGDYKEYDEEPRGFFHIVNFEAIAAEPSYFTKKYDMLIVDEVHYLKSRTAKRTKTMKTVAQTIPRRLGMTGTPVAKDPLDIWSIYDVLEPDIFPNRYIDFEEKVAIKKMIGSADRQFPKVIGWKPDGIDWINQNIYQRAIRYQSEECLDLPEKVYQKIVIEMPDSVEKFYKELKEELVAEFGTMGEEGYHFVESPNSLAVVSKLRQVASGFVGLPDEETPTKVNYRMLDDFKFDAIMDLLDNLKGHQVIIWYWHSFVRDHLVARIKKKFKENPMVIDGETSSTEKAKRIHRFQGGAYRFAVWNVQVSEGNTATAADVAIYMENSFAYKDRHQSEGRIYREGQKKKTTFIDVATKGTVDLRVLKAIEEGETLSNAVLLETVGEW